MKKLAIAGVLLASLAASVPLHAAEEYKMPVPTKEHKWLQKFAGNWDSEMSVFMEPGKPPVKTRSTESFRMVGGFWVQGEGKCQMMGQPYSSLLTIGYDPAKKNYFGTWLDSASSYLWKYTGSVDKTGKILTLMTSGPCPMKPGENVQFKEVTEFKSDDHRVFTSYILDKGKWIPMVSISSRRKK